MNFNLSMMSSLYNKNVSVPSLKDFALYTEDENQILFEDGTVLVQELYSLNLIPVGSLVGQSGNYIVGQNENYITGVN